MAEERKEAKRLNRLIRKGHVVVAFLSGNREIVLDKVIHHEPGTSPYGWLLEGVVRHEREYVHCVDLTRATFEIRKNSNGFE